jgi:hypothetical protein
MSLKKQIKELKADLLKKDEESENFRRNIKLTKVNELEVQIKTYQDECLRLRGVLDNVIRSKDPVSKNPQQLQQLESMMQQKDQLINQLQSDNIELAKLAHDKEEVSKHRDASQNNDEKSAKQLKSELFKTKKSLKEKEKEL